MKISTIIIAYIVCMLLLFAFLNIKGSDVECIKPVKIQPSSIIARDGPTTIKPEHLGHGMPLCYVEFWQYDNGEKNLSIDLYRSLKQDIEDGNYLFTIIVDKEAVGSIQLRGWDVSRPCINEAPGLITPVTRFGPKKTDKEGNEYYFFHWRVDHDTCPRNLSLYPSFLNDMMPCEILKHVHVYIGKVKEG